ncbi:MAG: GNAT family N-acetyltransferase [Syntrophotaleaceae bacterium]
MMTLLRLKYFKFLEYWHQHGFLPACCFTLYHKDEAVPVAKDLSSLQPAKVSEEDMQLVELTPDIFSSTVFKTPYRNCPARAKVYFRQGYRCLALMQHDSAVGDLWYVSRSTARTQGVHPDLHRLRIDLADNEVYMFDMHVSSQQRGGGLATNLLSSSLHYLRREGYSKAWGYYSAHNIPALWVHRLIGYQEFPHFILRRFFVLRSARAKN